MDIARVPRPGSAQFDLAFVASFATAWRPLRIGMVDLVRPLLHGMRRRIDQHTSLVLTSGSLGF